MDKYLSVINVLFLIFNAFMLYWTFIHNKKKEFENQLYNEKYDAYKIIIEKTYAALKKLNVEVFPFEKINEIKNKEEWEEFYKNEIHKYFEIGEGLEDLANIKSLYIPTEILEKFIDLSRLCQGYVINYSHLNPSIIVDCEERLWSLFLDLVNLMRSDLKIDLIDENLKQRMLNSMNHI